MPRFYPSNTREIVSRVQFGFSENHRFQLWSFALLTFSEKGEISPQLTENRSTGRLADCFRVGGHFEKFPQCTRIFLDLVYARTLTDDCFLSSAKQRPDIARGPKNLQPRCDIRMLLCTAQKTVASQGSRVDRVEIDACALREFFKMATNTATVG